jgi:cytochrome c oxidase assembly protein subunit 15
MTRSMNDRRLHAFAVLAAVATLCLIWIGGLVTSHGAGMAVPDWPTTYGYNMFFFPISNWVGGVFYEHTHRLFAAFVGLFTSVLAASIWGRETRGRIRWIGWGIMALLVGMLSHRGSGNAVGGLAAVPIHFRVLAALLPPMLIGAVVMTFRTRGALRWLAFTAFLAVIFQGVLGGFRVAEMKDTLGIFHATLAQIFFATLCAIALLTSRWWKQAPNFRVYEPRRLAYVTALVTGLIFLQLVLGAIMRHQHAGLAIPDFPLAYGKLWPALDADSVARYNQVRFEVNAQNPITATNIALQMVHRFLAIAILAAVAWACRTTVRRTGWRSPFGRLSAVWLGLILIQAFLGASVIWTQKAADLATAHVAVGALSLATGMTLALLLWRVPHTAKAPTAVSTAELPTTLRPGSATASA